jgi:hypothetical protein
MKLEKVMAMFMAAFIVLAMAYLFLKDTGNNAGITLEASAEKNLDQTAERSFGPKTTGSMGAGDVVIELTPQPVDKNLLAVNFSINSHSVSLSRFDLKDITVLEHEEHVFKPVKASRIGGHHSSGVIVFDVGDKVGNKDGFRIRLRGIPDVQERVYEWS